MTSSPSPIVTVRIRIGRSNEIEVSAPSAGEAIRELREAEIALRASLPTAESEELEMAHLQSIREELAAAARYAPPGAAVTLQGRMASTTSRSAAKAHNSSPGDQSSWTS